MNDILEKLKKEISNNSTIIIATSGGPDSMVLLNLLSTVKKEKNLKLVCAHVNHKLRKESDSEAEMVKKYCEKEKITFEYITIDEYKGNTENYAREKRYDFFEQLIKKYNAPYLLTAHHGDDLIETIIMRLIRGSSLKGYSGFSEVTEKHNYKIIRPLITKTKSDLLKYADDNHIPYALDKTNDSDVFTRNRIRKYILPKLKDENKNIHLKFLEFSKTLNETEDYFNQILENIIPNIYQNKKINVQLFLNQHTQIQKKIIHYILNKTYQNNISAITDKHVSNILNVLKNNKPNQKINLPYNKVFIKSYNNAWLEESEKVKKYDYILKEKLDLPNNYIIEIIDKIDNNSNYITKLNSKDLKMPIHVRNRKKGDKLTLKGSNNTKKIKDIFINEKIPLNERQTWPIVTDNNDEIIWLPGLKKTKFDIENNQNYDIIIRYRKKGSL